MISSPMAKARTSRLNALITLTSTYMTPARISSRHPTSAATRTPHGTMDAGGGGPSGGLTTTGPVGGGGGTTSSAPSARSRRSVTRSARRDTLTLNL
ncbi:hypothetical protein GCM10010405_41490 [Streptomyces macrosporus]|uniref:Uncharacterized protein n=1 Tax=Streptomyces macrosporus TaxID=44032 RepID=A0ABP5XDZ0_9ACTN